MLSKALLLAALMLAAFSAYSCERSIRVIEFAPYSYIQNEQWAGIDVDLSNHLLGVIGCKARFVELPFARAISLLKSDELDVIFNLTESESRREYVQFIGPTHQENLILVLHRRHQHTINSLAEITELDFHFGVQRGVIMGSRFDFLFATQGGFKSKLKFLSEIDPMINMVTKHRLDGFFIEILHLEYMQSIDDKYNEVVRQPALVHKTEVYMGLNKKRFSGNDIITMQKHLDGLIISGKLGQIRKAHMSRLAKGDAMVSD